MPFQVEIDPQAILRDGWTPHSSFASTSLDRRSRKRR